MSITEPRSSGRQQLAAISRSMAGLQREHYGRESGKVNAYAIKDMIVVVVRLKHLTPLEKSMVDRGEPERVLALRADFARVMAGRYTHTVERVTGRTVVALLSQAHVDPDIIVETFFLDRLFGSRVTEGLAEVIDPPEGGRCPGEMSVRGSIDVSPQAGAAQERATGSGPRREFARRPRDRLQRARPGGGDKSSGSACDDRRVTTTTPETFAAIALERLRTLTADDSFAIPTGAARGDSGCRRGSRPRVVRAAHRVGKVGRVLRRDRAAARGRRGTDVDHQSAAGADAQPDQPRRSGWGYARKRSTAPNREEWDDVRDRLATGTGRPVADQPRAAQQSAVPGADAAAVRGVGGTAGDR